MKKVIEMRKVGVVEITRAKKHPEEFPCNYEGLRQRWIRKQWKQAIFKLDGRLFFDFEGFWEMVQEAKK